MSSENEKKMFCDAQKVATTSELTKGKFVSDAGDIFATFPTTNPKVWTPV